MLGLKSTVLAGVLVIALSGVCYGLYHKAERAEEALLFEQAGRASVEAALESSLQAIHSLNQRIKDAQKTAQEFSEGNKKLQQEFNDKETKFKNHIGRLEDAFKSKPQLMSKLVNRSFDKFIDQVSCNSGDTKSCKK